MTTELGKITSSTGYKFNNLEDIKTHSSWLYNERMAILFYLLDMKFIIVNASYDLAAIKEVKSILQQIYKNVRMLISYNPTMRSSLNLDTKDNGIYTTDVMFSVLDKRFEWCDENGYTMRKIYVLVKDLNNLQVTINEILQYYSYFMKPNFKQKPDIDLATESYKQMIDKLSLDELKLVVGEKHKLDFNELNKFAVEYEHTGEKIDLAEDYKEDEEDENQNV